MPQNQLWIKYEANFNTVQLHGKENTKLQACKFINILHYITPYKAWKVINKNLEEITKEKERGLRGHTSPFQDDTLYPHNQGFPPQEHASLSTKIVGDGKIRCQK